MRILIVEGNSPELITRVRKIGGDAAHSTYAAALRAYDPSLEIVVAEPSAPGFDAASIDLGGISGAALTGSGVSWSANAPEARPHIDLFEKLMEAALPVIGSCWGMQVAAVAFGGEVGPNPIGREIGVARSIRLTEDGQAHPIFTNKPPVFDSICIHRDEVTRLPQSATLLATNDHSRVQAFAQDSFVGWQYHPELSLGDIADYLATPGRNVMTGGVEFNSEAELQQVIVDFRSISEDPLNNKALCWRYGVTEHASDPNKRMRELRNWVGMIRSQHD